MTLEGAFRKLSICHDIYQIANGTWYKWKKDIFGNKECEKVDYDDVPKEVHTEHDFLGSDAAESWYYFDMFRVHVISHKSVRDSVREAEDDYRKSARRLARELRREGEQDGQSDLEDYLDIAEDVARTVRTIARRCR